MNTTAVGGAPQAAPVNPEGRGAGRREARVPQARRRPEGPEAADAAGDDQPGAPAEAGRLDVRA